VIVPLFRALPCIARARYTFGMHMLSRIVLCVSLSLAFTGCALSPAEAERERISQVNTPLPVDPSDNIEIGPWWSDGQHLLNLRADGGYSIYDRNNRYARPIDRGRWGRQNYATLWLLPYTGLEPQRVRAQVVKVDHRFGLSVPNYKTMFALAAPPAVMEDQLLGAWRSEAGVLTLKADLTYVFAPNAAATTAAGTPVVGHNGKWKLAGERITLVPTTPSVPQQSLLVQPGETSSAADAAPANPTMTGPGGQFTKADEPGK
jgi:hypothetical protein